MPGRRHLHKADPEVKMLVVKIGGPAYRIGMGGGAASSLPSGCVGICQQACLPTFGVGGFCVALLSCAGVTVRHSLAVQV
jgi:hypothetical protein